VLTVAPARERWGPDLLLLDLRKLIGVRFVWDPRKAAANVKKHGVPLPPPNGIGCGTIADCGGFRPASETGGGVCGCQ
jgi:hypothetical protein